MVKSHAGRGLLLSSNLPQLQNLIKRDPSAYKEEFLQQWNHYKSIIAIFQENTLEQIDKFTEMITFITQVTMATGILSLEFCLVLYAGCAMLPFGSCWIPYGNYKLAHELLWRNKLGHEEIPYIQLDYP